MLSQPDHQADGRPWPSGTRVATGAWAFAEPRFEWRRLLAELGGTFFMVLVAAGADVVNAVSGAQIGRAAAVTAPRTMVLALTSDPFLLDLARPRIPLAEHEVQQRWASYEEMATRGPSRFPADGGAKRPRDPGHLAREFNGGSGQA